METNECLTDIFANSRSHFVDINESCPSLRATPLEELGANRGRKSNKQYENICVFGVDNDSFITCLCSMRSMKKEASVCLLVTARQLWCVLSALSSDLVAFIVTSDVKELSLTLKPVSVLLC